MFWISVINIIVIVIVKPLSFLQISDFNSDGEPLTLCGDQSPGIVFTSTSTEVLVAFSSNETGLHPANGFGYRLIASFLVDPGKCFWHSEASMLRFFVKGTL